MDKVLLQKGLHNDLFQELLPLIKQHKIPVQRVPAEKLQKITKKNHQGVIGFISAITYASLDHIVSTCFAEGRMPFILILDRVTDVRNFGALTRTAECAGVDAVVIPSRGSARIGADAVKTSAGALHHIPVCREDNLKEALDYLSQSGVNIVACTEKASSTLYQADLKPPVAIIMGSEEDGISPEYLKRANEQVLIPMQGNIESLNVSVAAGIMLFEVQRQAAL